MKKVQYQQLLIVFGIVIAILLLVVMVKSGTGVSVCLFKSIFHIPCPGCGISRGVFAIFTGHFLTALSYNLLSYPLAIGAVILVIWNGYDLIKGKTTFFEWLHRLKIHKLGFIMLFLFVLANWAYNIYRGF